MFSHSVYQLSDNVLGNADLSEVVLIAQLGILSALMRNHAH